MASEQWNIGAWGEVDWSVAFSWNCNLVSRAGLILLTLHLLHSPIPVRTIMTSSLKVCLLHIPVGQLSVKHQKEKKPCTGFPQKAIFLQNLMHRELFCILGEAIAVGAGWLERLLLLLPLSLHFHWAYTEMNFTVFQICPICLLLWESMQCIIQRR